MAGFLSYLKSKNKIQLFSPIEKAEIRYYQGFILLKMIK